ncbi:glycoside hydrolase family 43 protein [Streptomyces liangshanensis]|uniref:glycoside hydrolase family 43 protein n=1 Tax=Streptomyces liangshanensis TaxID=2717324 RepID=UPI0036DADA22
MRHTASRRLGRLLTTVLTVLTSLTVVSTSAAGPAAGTEVPARAATAGPVLDRNFPDPDLVKVGRTYHAYATSGNGKNIQHATSTDLDHWSVADTDPLPALGAWVRSDEPRVWAPEVYANGKGYTMLYTARDRASDKQCIGAALASSPDGPFRPAGEGPLVCPTGQGGAIDAASYTERGHRYMLWKNDGNCCGLDTWLHMQATSWDGTRLTGEPTRLIKQDRDWEGDLVEAPTLVERGGHYVLFYSADAYDGDRYKTGYAVASSLTGPYTKAAAPLMTTATFAGAVTGPGGQDVVTAPDGRDRIVFHGWSADRSRRSMYAADLTFAAGHPVVAGSKALRRAAAEGR